MPLLRSNVEFAKRVFLDRLTADQGQPLVQPANIDEGPGDYYAYGGCFDPYNFGVGADCSGLAGIVVGAAINGPAHMFWGRLFSTETFPDGFNEFRRTSQADLVAGNYPIKVMIMHGGGGPDSHMAVWIDGWNMESNGDYGVCTEPPEITGVDSDYWNDWWVYNGGGISEDTPYRQPLGYPRGVDYAGGRLSGADLVSNGISFVSRYLTDGGAGLPGKKLLPDEFTDLIANGISVVFNWETDGLGPQRGASQGTSDAQNALNYIRSLPGAPPNPVVYFSCDWDAAPGEQGAINAYFAAASAVLGGPDHVGIYAGYWPLSRALDAGVCRYAWQTEAWSGGNVDARVNIVQRNTIGYQTIRGIQCDIDESHTDVFGQFPVGGKVIVTETTQDLILDQLSGPVGPDGQRHGWPQLNKHSVVDALAEIGAHLGLTGYRAPSLASGKTPTQAEHADYIHSHISKTAQDKEEK